MSTNFTRNPENIINTLNLKYTKIDTLQTSSNLDIYIQFMQAMKSMIMVLPVTMMDGYNPQPDRYWIRPCMDKIAIFVTGSDEEQRFVWKTEGKNDIVLTKKIASDSIVFLLVQGDTLSYDNGNKLLFIECNEVYKHPIQLAFIDNFGLPQTCYLETGAWSSTAVSHNTFRSIEYDITYDLEKSAKNQLTVGDTSIPRELQLFFSGLVTSRAQRIIIGNKTAETSMSDITLNADSFTKLYNISGIINVNTIDMPTLQIAYGEINIHD